MFITTRRPQFQLSERVHGQARDACKGRLPAVRDSEPSALASPTRAGVSDLFSALSEIVHTGRLSRAVRRARFRRGAALESCASLRQSLAPTPQPSPAQRRRQPRRRPPPRKYRPQQTHRAPSQRDRAHRRRSKALRPPSATDPSSEIGPNSAQTASASPLFFIGRPEHSRAASPEARSFCAVSSRSGCRPGEIVAQCLRATSEQCGEGMRSSIVARSTDS